MTPLDWMDVAGPEADEPRGPAPAELLEGLNEAQAQAVQAPEGPLLILAGAGSGKTRVITRRLAWLVATGRVDPSEVIAITFTNKAAKEMRGRVQALIPAGGLWVSTFHSACARILRRDIELLSPFTRDFTILDTADRNALLKELVKDLGFDPARFRPAALGAWISHQKNTAKETGVAEESVFDGGIEQEVFLRVGAAYAERMASQNALDFDDLQLKVLELFEKHPGVRDVYAHRFRHVLVDEYQDTNRVQYLLVRHLSSHHGNLAVCGDPDQSIYAWRGADVRNILDFETDYPGATVVKLEQNYRSTKNILGAAQAVVSHNKSRKEKDLWSDSEAGEPVEVFEAGDENEEADEIARLILAERSRGRSLDQIAVFYRVNFMQRALERGLRLASIPYRVAGGVEFFQRREIKDLVSYLHLLVNPNNDVAFRRAVNVPPRGIGAKSLEVVASFAADRRLPMSQAIRSEECLAGVRGKGKKGLLAFAQLLEHLEAFKDAAAADAVGAVIDQIDFFGYLAETAERDGVDREENIEELLANAKVFDRDQPEGGLRGFLEDIALVSEVDDLPVGDPASGQAVPEDHEPKVSLMTLHAAKGLEFDVVFLPGLEEDLLPHVRALEEDDGTGGRGEEEERRLLYVGMTRARQRLVISYANTRMYFGETSWRQASRFLDELPDGVQQSEGPEDEHQALGDFESGADDADLDVGVWVLHPHFGRGLVERLVGSGANARATVRFTHHGSKTLLLQYAKLERVDA